MLCLSGLGTLGGREGLPRDGLRSICFSLSLSLHAAPLKLGRALRHPVLDPIVQLLGTSDEYGNEICVHYTLELIVLKFGTACVDFGERTNDGGQYSFKLVRNETETYMLRIATCAEARTLR